MMNNSPAATSKITGFALVSALAILCSLPAVAEDGAAANGDAETTNEANLWIEGSPAIDLGDLPSSPYAKLVREVGPAVVNILVSYDDRQRPPHARQMPSPQFNGLAEGSGFIIHPDGYILTNFHVIDRASTVTIKFEDKSELEANVIGGDPLTDLALLKVEADDPLPVVPLGDSSAVEVGDYVVAIGNPLGLSHSVTAGIISALDRRDLPIEGQEHQGNFIQVDAPINPGNSGGPLINMRGEVIGINTAINRQGQGISFAIPSNLVKALLPQLHERGYVVRSWLGVRIQPLDPLLARSFDLGSSGGALVTEVLPDSPAERAGIKKRDVIVSLNDESVDDSDELPLMVSTIPEGAKTVLHIIRDGEAMSLEVDLEALPDQSPPDLPGSEPTSEVDTEPAGVEVTAMTETLSRELSAPEDTGVVVTSLSESSPARQAGLRNRDVILQVGTTVIDSESAFQDAIDALTNDDVVRLKVLRNGRSVYMAFTR